MSRYKNSIQTVVPSFNYESIISGYMISEGFSQVNYKGQTFWKKGFGITIGPQYMSIQFLDNKVYIEAFIRSAIFPGVYVGEMGINGFVGAIPKGLLAKRVRTVEDFINRLNNENNNKPV